jgi:hypothetical protein
MEIRLPSVGEIRLKYGGNTIEIHLPSVGEIIDFSFYFAEHISP